MKPFRTVLITAAMLCISSAVFAAELVADAARIASMPIHGARYNMTPKQAFEHFWSLGYRAGNIESFADWDTDGIEFVRGDHREPEGISRITMGRKGDRITSLSETWNRPLDHFSAPELVEQMRVHFGLPADTNKCRAAAQAAGHCRVQDAEDSHDVDLVYGLQILPGMLIRHVDSRRAHSM